MRREEKRKGEEFPLGTSLGRGDQLKLGRWRKEQLDDTNGVT
jgi:hypothetical protein